MILDLRSVEQGRERGVTLLSLGPLEAEENFDKTKDETDDDDVSPWTIVDLFIAKLPNSRNIEITSWTWVVKQDPDENVPEAQHTTDGVGDVILGSTVVRDEDGAEILEDILSVIWW